MLKFEDKFLPVKPNPNEITHLQCSVGYEKGGTNSWSGSTNNRGFYLYVIPVTVTVRMDPQGREYKSIAQNLFLRGRGNKLLLKAASRYSDKQHLAAIELAKEQFPYLRDIVLEDQGLELAQEGE